MSDVTDSDPLALFTRTLQIIIGALVMGVVSFLVIVLLFIPDLSQQGPARAEAEAAGPAQAARAADLPIITYVALAMGASVLVMSFAIPKLVASQSRRQIAKGTAPKLGKADEEDTAALLPIFQTQLIIGGALLEGGAFFATVAYMLERQPIALGAAGILLGLLVTRFPTVDRLRGWLDRQIAILQEERQAIL